MIKQKKRYYYVAEVARELGISDELYYSWMKTFPYLKPRKKRNGFTALIEPQVDYAKKVKKLLGEGGMTHEGAKRFLDQGEKHNFLQEDDFKRAVKKELRSIYKFLKGEENASQDGKPDGANE